MSYDNIPWERTAIKVEFQYNIFIIIITRISRNSVDWGYSKRFTKWTFLNSEDRDKTVMRVYSVC